MYEGHLYDGYEETLFWHGVKNKLHGMENTYTPGLIHWKGPPWVGHRRMGQVHAFVFAGCPDGYEVLWAMKPELTIQEDVNTRELVANITARFWYAPV